MQKTTIGSGVGWNVYPGPRKTEMLHVMSILWSGDRDAPCMREFPGANPSSLMSEDLELLRARRDDYVVAEKTDGVRYWLCAAVVDSAPMVWLCNRAFHIVQIGVGLRHEAFRGTLLDVEVVRRKDGLWDLMVFDAIATCGVHCGHQTYTQRMACAASVLERCDPKGVFHAMRAKPTVPATEIQKVFATLETLDHPTDGILMTPISEPVRRGLHPTMFKVKPAHMNTADLFMALDPEDGNGVEDLARVGVVLGVTDGPQNYVEVGKAVVDIAALGIPLGKLINDQKPIVECRWVDGAWQPFAYRSDKRLPNSLFVVNRTARNVVEKLWEEQLSAALLLPLPKVSPESKKHDESLSVGVADVADVPDIAVAPNKKKKRSTSDGVRKTIKKK